MPPYGHQYCPGHTDIYANGAHYYLAATDLNVTWAILMSSSYYIKGPNILVLSLPHMNIRTAPIILTYTPVDLTIRSAILMPRLHYITGTDTLVLSSRPCEHQYCTGNTDIYAYRLLCLRVGMPIGWCVYRLVCLSVSVSVSWCVCRLLRRGEKRREERGREERGEERRVGKREPTSEER